MTLKFTFENIAGIRSGEAVIEKGVNAVRSSNWQGKSSFLTAIETAMGTKTVLTEGQDQGRVSMEIDDESIEIELVRENGTVLCRGDPYFTSEQLKVCSELYAFLDEENEVRQTVRNGENLKEVLTRPLNFENIDERIAELSQKRDRLDSELDQANDAASKLPTVERAINSLKDDLNGLRQKRAEYDVQSADDVSGHHEELSNAIAERDQVKNRIERLERTVERTEDKLDEKRAAIDDLKIPSADPNIDAQITETKNQLEEVQRNSDLLQSIYAPTKRLLEENKIELITEVERDLVSDTVVCWTCGEDTTEEDVESRLQTLGEHVTEYRSRADELRQKLEELEERRAGFESAKQQKRTLERRIADLDATLDDRQTSLESAYDRLEELETHIEDLSAEVEKKDERITDIESDIKYTEARLEERQEERESLETEASQREPIQERRDEVAAEIRKLRTRKEEVKQRTRESFENAMDEVLERFETGFESARLTSEFDLVVAREGRETEIGALSDGEVELLGIVAALAGYESFEMTDRIPVLLVDDLGKLADENVTQLIDYLQDRADYLVFTAYPEHTSVESNTIEPTDWSVVSPQTGT